MISWFWKQYGFGYMTMHATVQRGTTEESILGRAVSAYDACWRECEYNNRLQTLLPADVIWSVSRLSHLDRLRVKGSRVRLPPVLHSGDVSVSEIWPQCHDQRRIFHSTRGCGRSPAGTGPRVRGCGTGSAAPEQLRVRRNVLRSRIATSCRVKLRTGACTGEQVWPALQGDDAALQFEGEIAESVVLQHMI